MLDHDDLTHNSMFVYDHHNNEVPHNKCPGAQAILASLMINLNNIINLIFRIIVIGKHSGLLAMDELQ